MGRLFAFLMASCGAQTFFVLILKAAPEKTDYLQEEGAWQWLLSVQRMAKAGAQTPTVKKAPHDPRSPRRSREAFRGHRSRKHQTEGVANTHLLRAEVFLCGKPEAQNGIKSQESGKYVYKPEPRSNTAECLVRLKNH